MPAITASRGLIRLSERIGTPTFRPPWISWPVALQFIWWFGPMIIMVAFFMAQSAGWIGSPEVKNGEKLDALVLLAKAQEEVLAVHQKESQQIINEYMFAAKPRITSDQKLLTLICIFMAKDKNGLAVDSQVERCVNASTQGMDGVDPTNSRAAPRSKLLVDGK